MKRPAMLNDDYAIIEGGGVGIYYGYEVEVEGQWAVALTDTESGRQRVFTLSEMEYDRDPWDTGETIMWAVGWMLRNGYLRPTTKPQEDQTDGS